MFICNFYGFLLFVLYGSISIMLVYFGFILFNSNYINKWDFSSVIYIYIMSLEDRLFVLFLNIMDLIFGLLDLGIWGGVMILDFCEILGINRLLVVY